MSGRRSNRWTIALSSLLVLVIVSLVPVRVAFATNLSPFIDLQERGLTLVNDGVGLAGWGGGPANLSVNVGGPVRFALLYWAGSERPCLESSPGSGNCSFVQPFKDQQVIFDGTPLTGTLIGTETQPVTPGGPTLHIGYFADVTSLVSAKGTGAQTFSFADGNPASNLWMLDGVSLLVAYTDAANLNWYRVLVWDGLDFAYGADATPGATRVTAPVTFNHGANDDARTAELYLIGGGGSASLLDEVTISNNPTQLNVFDSDDGAAWDDDVSSITIPAGVGTTTVQAVSPASAAPTGCGQGYWKNHPDAWAGPGYAPDQTVGSVFSGASAFPSLASQTLLAL